MVYENFKHDIKFGNDDEESDFKSERDIADKSFFEITQKLRKSSGMQTMNRSLSETATLTSTLRFATVRDDIIPEDMSMTSRPETPITVIEHDIDDDFEHKLNRLVESSSMDHDETKSENDIEPLFYNRLSNKKPLQTMARLDDAISNEGKTEKEKELYHKMRKCRLVLFNKSEITQSAVNREISYIFDQIQKHRNNKITSTNMDQYRQSLNAKLLKDDESLQYIFEQLSRHATFYPSKMKRACPDDKILKQILVDELEFGDDHFIDKQVIPKAVKSASAIRQLFRHMKKLYAHTFPDRQLTLIDILAIIMLYRRIFNKLRERMNENGDAFLVSHDVFCKFVDSKFKMELPMEEWGAKSKAASDLFQAC